MKILRLPILLFALTFLSIDNYAQNSDSTKGSFNEKVKDGWNFGLLPAVAFDADLGFRYGAIVNAFNYGDGSRYPKYDHNIYLEWSRTTKGNKTAILAYDSEQLIPKLRFSLNVQYLTEKAMDFYGFNGYNSLYNAGFEDTESDLYKSRMFYRVERRFLMVLADFEKKIPESHFKIMGGLNFYSNKIGSVDIAKLNKGKDTEDLLPSLDSVPGLYENYLKWNVLPQKDITGGKTAIVKLGIVYDTRDFEPNPMKGIWTEAMVLMAPKINSDFASYSQIALTQRQYFTLKDKVLNIAYRLSYQQKLGGSIPFYMLPFVPYSNKPTRDGLGGAKTLRGIKRDRVVGEGMAFGNVELRWKFFRRVIGSQNIFLVWSGFCDAGLVTKKYKLNLSDVPAEMLYLFPDTNESVHVSYGTGLHVVMNQNFIIAFDYGIPVNKEDGNSGFYINLDFLF